MPVNYSAERKHIVDFLNDHHSGVLASADKKGRPHAAAIYFTFDESLNIQFLTKKETTKFSDLEDNPLAVLVVYDQAKQTSVQIKGQVIEIKDMGRVDRVIADILHIATLASDSGVPPLSKLRAGAYVVFRIIPDSIRMAMYTQPDPSRYDTIFEEI